jgi:hypothetical protein
MIVSKPFLNEIYAAIDLGYFEHSYIQQVAKWVLEYFDRYGDVPNTHMIDIYNAKKSLLKEGEPELVRDLLTLISDNYSTGGINDEYLSKQTRLYFKKRELELTLNNLTYFLDKSNLDAAEEVILGYNKIAKRFSEWVNPFDDAVVHKVFENVDVPFFKFPGKLGTFLKNFERGWLVGISAPFKRGKTWFAQEFGIIGVFESCFLFFRDDQTKNIGTYLQKIHGFGR